MLQYVAEEMLQKVIKMYHIKNDFRSRRTAQTLGKAMFQILRTKTLGEVSVSDLYRETGVARSTFYRLFDTPEDVLYYLCAQYVENASKEFEGRTFSDIRELSIASINLSIEHHELLEILIRNHRQDLLSELFAANFRNINARIPVLEGLDETAFEYVQSLLYAAMASLQTSWFLRGQKESPEQLYAYLQKYEEVLRKTLMPNG